MIGEQGPVGKTTLERVDCSMNRRCFIWLLLLLAACRPGTPAEPGPVDRPPGNTAAPPPAVAIPAGRVGDTTLRHWMGDYGFFEYLEESLILMNWELRVVDTLGRPAATLEVNGHMMAMKLFCRLEGDRKRLAVIMDRAIEGRDRQLQPGDTLFLLTRKGDRMLTTWKASEPQLSDRPAKPAVAFERS